MNLIITAEPIPLKADESGVVRVGGTRVTLETVIISFNQGATAEEIVQQYPSLKLADVYATIAYYLSKKAEVDAYLQQQQKIAEEIRTFNEARFNSQGIRSRLLARQAEIEKDAQTSSR